MPQTRVRIIRLLAATCGGVLLAGCARPGGQVMGVPPSGKPQTIAAARAAAAGTPMVLRGEMVEKCPIAGCWFVLRDEKGTMKVDLATAKFVVVEVPLHSTMTVAGKTAGNGDGRFLDATGLRY